MTTIINKIRILLIILISIFLSLLIVELLFRIWSPPQVKLMGKNILLKKNITTNNLYNFDSEKIKNNIVITKNSLGFRGPEAPLNFSKHLTLIAVGGSTTECIFITEGKTWVDYLQSNLIIKYPNMWVNNAGIDGHSTWGHIELMKQYIGNLRPNYVLFLVGINDMAIDGGRDQDKQQIVGSKELTIKNMGQRLIDHSMVLAYFKFQKNKKTGHDITALNDSIVNYKVLGTTTNFETVSIQDLEKFDKLLIEYKNRLKTLIYLSKENSIKPIFVTQPAVYGFGIDEVTGIDLGEIPISDFTEDGVVRKGSDKWMLLQKYNNVTREVANEFNIPLIDLANEMPKNTKYYYDYIHFTEEGAQKVGEILSKHLVTIL